MYQQNTTGIPGNVEEIVATPSSINMFVQDGWNMVLMMSHWPMYNLEK